MNELTIYDENFQKQLESTAKILAKSALIPTHLRNKPIDVFLVLTMGHELNLKPMMALQQINVIQGSLTMSAQLMLGLVKKECPNAKIQFELVENPSNPKVICRVKENKEDEDWDYVATWDMTKAAAMGLSHKDNYKKQAMNMLKWRASSEALRAVFPHILNGFYATEEFQDFSGKEIRVVENEIDEDFPIPENEKIPGPEYRVQNGKFRGKQLMDIPNEEIIEYVDTLDKREVKTQLKPWEHELREVMVGYVMDQEQPTECEGGQNE